jgi:hypothetical protein
MTFTANGEAAIINHDNRTPRFLWGDSQCRGVSRFEAKWLSDRYDIASYKKTKREPFQDGSFLV